MRAAEESPQTVRSASVGERRAARIAGKSPAAAPIASAAPTPANGTQSGTAGSQPRVAA